MQNTNWWVPALIGVGLITLLRVILLAFNQTDLFVDEAQYWLWGQHLDFGYYSKPPMIGWVIAAFTILSDSQFWVRLPGPLFHCATGLILGAISARLFDRRAAILVALAYVTLPMVAVGSLLISTDTIMFPFLALAFYGYLRVLDGQRRWAILSGVALGLAFLSKYAAVYFILCAVIAAPIRRLAVRDVLVLLGMFLVTISPNLIWNLLNGLSTVEHTLDNADWVRNPSARAGLNWQSLGDFFASQFAVFGPVLFAGLLVLAVRWRRIGATQRFLLLFTLPIILLVCTQALLSKAYANWAAAAYLAGVLVTVPWLSRGWVIASFLVNGALCLLFPVATTMPYALKQGDQPLLGRYIGRHEISDQILKTAEAHGTETIVADHRDVLADLFYTARNQPVQLFAKAPKGRAPHHYALNFPYRPNDAKILFVTGIHGPAPCDAAQIVAELRPTTGAYRRHPLRMFVMPGTCLEPL